MAEITGTQTIVLIVPWELVQDMALTTNELKGRQLNPKVLLFLVVAIGLFDGAANGAQCGDWGYPPGDINRDCVVDLIDFALLTGIWGQCSDPSGLNCQKVFPAGLSKGHKWLREYGLLLSGWAGGLSDIDQYFDDTNFSDIFTPNRFLLPYHRGIPPAQAQWAIFTNADGASFNEIINDPANWPLGGFMTDDEPLIDHPLHPTYVEVEQHINDTRAAAPSALTFANLFAPWWGGAQLFMDAYCAGIKPDILMIDQYPFDNNDFTDATYMRIYFYAGLAYTRYKALTCPRVDNGTGIPYWIFLQGYNRMPLIRTEKGISESDMRMQIFACMTYGFKGFSYWTYLPSSGGPEVTGFFEDDLVTPTQFFWDVAASNIEVANLGKALVWLTSTDVRYVPHPGGSLPEGIGNFTTPQWDTGADPLQSSVTVSGNGYGQDFLIGYFQDDAGEDYFMATNVYRHPFLNAAPLAKTITIAFDNSVDSLLRLNRLTGQVETVNLTNNTLTLTLPGGTGDLFKYDTGTAFAGVGCGGWGYLAEDLNGDCQVGADDLSVLFANWFSCTDPNRQGCSP